MFAATSRISTLTRNLAFGTAAVAAGTVLYASSVHAKQDTAAALGKEFKAFKLKDVTPINHNTSKFTFALDSADQPMGLSVASALLVRAKVNGKDEIRPYTPVNQPEDLGKIELIVKRYESGVVSKHIHSLKVGDSLEMKGPLPKLAYKPNMKKEIGMIAGGTGITPMYQVIKAILKDSNDHTKVSLVFANIEERDILLKKELEELVKKHKNFKVHYVLEKPPSGWTGSSGYVNETVVKKHLPAPEDNNLILVCGPPPMMEAISGDKDKVNWTQGELKGALKRMGYTPEQVYKF